MKKMGFQGIDYQFERTKCNIQNEKNVAIDILKLIDWDQQKLEII